MATSAVLGKSRWENWLLYWEYQEIRITTKEKEIHSTFIPITITRHRHQDVLMFFFRNPRVKTRMNGSEIEKLLKSMCGTWRSWLRCKLYPKDSFWSINIFMLLSAIAISSLIHQTNFGFSEWTVPAREIRSVYNNRVCWGKRLTFVLRQNLLETRNGAILKRNRLMSTCLCIQHTLNASESTTPANYFQLAKESTGIERLPFGKACDQGVDNCYIL